MLQEEIHNDHLDQLQMENLDRKKCLYNITMTEKKKVRCVIPKQNKINTAVMKKNIPEAIENVKVG